MGMGCTRVVERVCAATGHLQRAPTRFESALDVCNGGVLWAVPALTANGLLKHAEDLFCLPPGYYSLLHIFLLLAFMALCRIKTCEQLRYYPAGEGGKLLGLDRIPEVRTLREKIKLLAEPERVNQWSRTLSQEWMEAHPERAGTLYVDGHVRVYHGSQTPLPRRYVARDRLCMRGTTDYWINDQHGDPFFVVSTPFTSGLLDMLRRDIVPRLLHDVPNPPTEEELQANPHRHRFILIFDREGYSPAFFAEMWEKRIACQTYHKYPKDDWPEAEFLEEEVEMPGGQSARMKLAERGVFLGGTLWVREIRKLTEKGHQTSIVSTDYTSNSRRIAVHMFSRWSQENFFRYMMQHYGIDRLIDYEVVHPDETRTVMNPAYRSLENQIKTHAGHLGRKQAKFGALVLSESPMAPETLLVYEREKGELQEEIELIERKLTELKEKRKQTPKHLPLKELPEEERFQQLAPTRKQFLDTIKMIAYRAETTMSTIVRKVLARVDDARSLIREIFTTEADLIPCEEEKTLTVRLHHLTNHLSDQAARVLAEELNATETLYPGTDLRLIYKLVSDENPPNQEL
jgi:prepilin-type processing-associated H-X9-DG protein